MIISLSADICNNNACNISNNLLQSLIPCIQSSYRVHETCWEQTSPGRIKIKIFINTRKASWKCGQGIHFWFKFCNYYNLFIIKFIVVYSKTKRHCYDHLSRASENTSLFQNCLNYSIFLWGKKLFSFSFKVARDGKSTFGKLFQCFTLSVKYIPFISTPNVPSFNFQWLDFVKPLFFRLFQLISVLWVETEIVLFKYEVRGAFLEILKQCFLAT